MNDPYSLYDELIAQAADADAPISQTASGEYWACVSANGRAGFAMATKGNTVSPTFPGGMDGLPLSLAAAALKSWNFPEASMAMAAVNAVLNAAERVERFGCYQPIERHYTDDLDFTGKTVGVVGHMRGSPRMREQAARIYILERDPLPGDYPDPACEYILPECDIVLISGSTLINKTLPRLLVLSKKAFTVLTGPSVPLYPGLLELGVDRIAGLALTEPDAALAHAARSQPGNPYYLGLPFVLSK
ncbi:MAG: hypothetical protein IJ594_00780 [Oscillospiraceae bacterium]|nr:hypothetical protein [Oscillospiraceae bacterium]